MKTIDITESGGAAAVCLNVLKNEARGFPNHYRSKVKVFLWHKGINLIRICG